MKKFKKKGKKSKIKGNPLTLEEVFSQIADTASSSSISPGLSNIVLTPMSSEVCLRHGINPEALKSRDFESFYKNNQADIRIQRMRYETYERRRHDLMRIASEEKARLAKKAKLTLADNDNKSISRSISFEQHARTKKLLKAEEKRLVKAKEKQKRELLQMLQFEQKLENIQVGMQLKAEKGKLLEEKRKARERKHIKRAADERRINELRRKAQEDAEQEIQRIAARESFEESRQIQMERLNEEIEHKRGCRLEEEEHEKKGELQRIQSQKGEEKKRKELQKKIEERELKEKERQAKVDLKRTMEQKELELKRTQIKKRIALNKEAALQQEEKRRAALMEKQEKSQKQYEKLALKRVREHMKNKQEQKALCGKREYQARLAKEREEATKEVLHLKFRECEDHLLKVKEAKQKKIMLLKEEREIHSELKKENVKRIRRMQEYKRLETMRIVALNDKRTDEILKEKERQAKVRRTNVVEAKIRKDKLIQVIETSKRSGGKAIKKILSQLFLECDETRSRTRKKKTKTSEPKLPDQKKQNELESSESGVLPEVINIGHPPKAPSLLGRITGEYEPVEPSYSPYLSLKDRLH